MNKAREELDEMVKIGGTITLDNDCYFFQSNNEDEENDLGGFKGPVPKNLLVAALEKLGLDVDFC